MAKRTALYRFEMAFALLFAASVVVTGCSKTTEDSVLERNKRLIRQMNHEVWNNGNVNALDQFCAPDFVGHFLPDGTEVKGIDSLREREARLREAFPDWTEDIKHIVAEGNLVVIHFVSGGTNEGSWLGNPPTGRRIRINEVSILRIEDGRIAEQWLMPDLFSMQQQLARPEEE